MASYLVLALVIFVGQVQCQEFVDEDVWEREFEFEPQRDQTAEGCIGKVADIFVILDSSTSIYIFDYRQELQFARDLVARFDIGQRNTRVGLLTFSDDITRPVLELNQFQTKSDVLANINEQTLPYRTGVTNTDQAIRYVRESTLFRSGITKVIVVITDGGSRSPWNTAREADLAREAGFYLFVIGVGQYQEEHEWRNIASDPDETFIFNVTNFRVLDQIKFTFPQRACSLPPLEVSRSCAVERNADLFFVAGPGSIQDAVQVIDRVVNATTERANFVRVSYLLDNCNNAENVRLANVNTYCDRLQFPVAANSDTYLQLLARLRLLARQPRRGTKQLAVLFIDEETLRFDRQFSRSRLIAEAETIAQTNIEIIVVDLATRGYETIIQGITTVRNNIITFIPGNVGAQRAVLNRLIDRLCVVINGSFFPNVGPVVA